MLMKVYYELEQSTYLAIKCTNSYIQLLLRFKFADDMGFHNIMVEDDILNWSMF